MIARLLRTSVRRKTLAVVMAAVLVALAVNAATLLFYEVRAFREAHLADLGTQAEIIGRASAAALSFNDRKAAAQDLALLRGRDDVTAAAVYGADGALFAAYAQHGEAPVPPHAGPPGYAFGADSLELYHPVLNGEDRIGTVYLRGRTGLSDRVRGYLGILVATMALSFAVAWLLSAWLQRAITQPIQEVAAAASTVFARRDLSVRARKTSDDEVGVLADALNRMLADLEREMADRREAEHALRTADRRKDEFLATLAHELRNPLAPIRNALYLMQLPHAQPAAVAEARAIVERQLAQMVRLVDDLLDVSRITTGKLALRRERVELRAVARNALESIEPLARARNVRLESELPQEGRLVNADPTRLAQVFLNLLNNAVKFSDPGGRIDFAVALEGADLVARVRDTGIGIAPEELEQIFEMFAQVDRSLERSTTGLGVGLSLARRLVELHGGTLEVKSDGVGRGAEFVVRIPGIAEPAPLAAPAAPRHDGPASGSARRILVADDNVDFATTFAGMLRSLGHEAHVTHDGEAALDAARRLRPQVAFLDIGMPKLNGFDLARALRASPETAHAILVAVTGWGQPHDRSRALQAGFDYHMVKPLDFDKVRELLAR